MRTIGRGLGQIVYYWDGRSRRVTERNIALAYPELSSADQNILVREILRETGALAGEMGHVWQAPWAQNDNATARSQRRLNRFSTISTFDQ